MIEKALGSRYGTRSTGPYLGSATHFASLTLSFLICNMDMMIIPTSPVCSNGTIDMEERTLK